MATKATDRRGHPQAQLEQIPVMTRQVANQRNKAMLRELGHLKQRVGKLALCVVGPEGHVHEKSGIDAVKVHARLTFCKQDPALQLRKGESLVCAVSQAYLRPNVLMPTPDQAALDRSLDGLLRDLEGLSLDGNREAQGMHHALGDFRAKSCVFVRPAKTSGDTVVYLGNKVRMDLDHDCLVQGSGYLRGRVLAHEDAFGGKFVVDLTPFFEKMPFVDSWMYVFRYLSTGRQGSFSSEKQALEIYRIAQSLQIPPLMRRSMEFLLREQTRESTRELAARGGASGTLTEVRWNAAKLLEQHSKMDKKGLVFDVDDLPPYPVEWQQKDLKVRLKGAELTCSRALLSQQCQNVTSLTEGALDLGAFSSKNFCAVQPILEGRAELSLPCDLQVEDLEDILSMSMRLGHVPLSTLCVAHLLPLFSTTDCRWSYSVVSSEVDFSTCPAISDRQAWSALQKVDPRALRRLSFASCRELSPHFFSVALQHAPQLQELSLRGCTSLTKKAFTRPLLHLRSLDLSYTPRLSREDVLFVLSNTPFVEKLSFSGLDEDLCYQLSEEELVKSFALCPHLRELELQEVVGFSPKMAKSLLTSCPHLEGVTFGHFPNTREAKEGLEILARAPSVRYLHLPVTHPVAGFLLPTQTHLRSIRLCLPSSSASKYVHALAQSSQTIRKVELTGPSKLAHGCLAALGKKSILSDFTMRGVECSIMDLSSLIVENPFLRTLDLSSTTFTEGNQDLQAWAVHLKNLRVFVLPHSCILNENLAHAVRDHCPRLRVLDLSSVRAEDGVLRAFVGRRSALEEVSLSRSVKVSDVGVMQLAKSTPELRKLDLFSCSKLTDESLEALSTYCPKLEEVHLGACSGLTTRGLCNFVQAMPSLQVVNIQHTNKPATLELLESCRDYLPRLRVLYAIPQAGVIGGPIRGGKELSLAIEKRKKEEKRRMRL